MTFLPIVARELRVAARSRNTFRVRFLIALATAGIGSLFLLTSLVPFVGGRSGATLFRTLVGLGFGLALLAGPFLTADSLSRERREGTLGFLFLTDLQGFDVVAGKLAALGLVPLHGLMAMFPVAGMTIFLGGVGGAEFWRAVVLILNTLFVSLAIGLWISSVVVDERQAVGLTFGGLAALAGVPEAIAWLAEWIRAGSPAAVVRLASPTATLRLVFDAGFRSFPRGFWMSLLYQNVLAWVALGFAAGFVRYAWRRDDSPAGRADRRVAASTASANPVRRAVQRVSAGRDARLNREGPFAWLAWRGSWARRAVGWWTGCIVLGAVVAFGRGAWEAPTAPSPAVGWFFAVGFGGLKVLLALHAIYFLQDNCRSGTMELILTTPISSVALQTGHFAAMRHLVVWPVVVMGLTHVALGLAARVMAGGDWPSVAVLVMAGVGPPLASVLIHALDLVAVACFATHAALRYDRPAKALAITAGFTLLLPAVFCGAGRVFVDLFVIGRLSGGSVRMRDRIRAWYFPGSTRPDGGTPRLG